MGPRKEMPPEIRIELERLTGDGAEPKLAVRSDIGPDGNFGEVWLIVTSGRMLTLRLNTADGSEDGDVTIGQDVRLADISSVQIESLGGAGVLSVTVRGQIVDMVRYSNTLSHDFAVVARMLDKLVKDGEMPEYHDDVEERFCPKCGRPLPEGSKVCVRCVSTVRTIGRMLSYLGAYKLRVAAIIVLMALGTGTALVPPRLIKWLIDDVLIGPAENTRLLLPIFIGIVSAHIGGAGIRILHGRLTTFVGRSVVFDLRAQVYGKLQMLSLSYYDRRQTGAVMSRVSHDTRELQRFIIEAGPWAISALFMLSAVGARMLWKSTWLTLWIIAPIPLLVVAARLFMPRLFVLMRRFLERRSRLSAALNSSLSGIRVVKAFGQEETEIKRFDKPNREMRDTGWGVDRYSVTMMPVMGLISMSGGILFYYFGGRSVIDQTLTIGDFSEFMLLIAMFREPINALLRLSRSITHALASAERLFEVVDSIPDVRDPEDPVDIGDVDGKIELRDVTFGYRAHKPVLHDINLTIEPGEMVGLVGRSGAGKSTMINLICRLYDVDDGRILVDGVDVRDMRGNDLRRQIGVVLQETFLFSGTILDNIAYGKPGATMPEIIRAAKAANAHDFIVNFPDGYDTKAGERGSRLSGGEKQRIAIARAILNDPKILILDEATSAVDTETERQIQQALERLTSTRTTVAIAHRLSTLQNAKRLLVLKSGKQAELGTHEELMARRGTYYKLVQMQSEISRIQTVGG